ncbi:MAG: adenine phosphoribosyltransferase [Zetaproteobacteria bacterium]|nr:adenine phosphoribosyltransferase [Zetaproteobacteria bacterium]
MLPGGDRNHKFRVDHQHQIKLLRAQIVMYPDYPQKGVLFRDMSPLLEDAEMLSMLMEVWSQRFMDWKVDVVVGIESRGLALACGLALKLKAGYLAMRKQHKLPGAVYRASYQKEYGPDVLELSQSHLLAGKKTLIVDDLIATGGTFQAAVQLVEEARGEVVCVTSVLDVAELDFTQEISVPSFVLLK